MFCENEGVVLFALIKWIDICTLLGIFRYVVFNVYISSQYIDWQIRGSEQSEEINMSRNGNSVEVYKNWQPV